MMYINYKSKFNMINRLSYSNNQVNNPILKSQNTNDLNNIIPISISYKP